MGLEFRFLDKSTHNKIQLEVNMETGSNTAFIHVDNTNLYIYIYIYIYICVYKQVNFKNKYNVFEVGS